MTLEKAIENLLTALDFIVHDNSKPYREKVKIIKAKCDDNDEANVEEFVAWFAGE